MIFLGDFKKINDTKWGLGLVHYQPFDPVYGLNKTEAELRIIGVLVNSIPEAPSQPGKTAVTYYNPTTSSFFFEYNDIPISDQEKLSQLQAENTQLRQAQADNTQALSDFMDFYFTMNPDQA